MTQQNAALVEQSAAAAESLKDQALQLVQAVASFKLGGTEPTRAAQARNGQIERRGPNRATNVTRPLFNHTPKAQPATATAPAVAPARTGSDDWTSF